MGKQKPSVYTGKLHIKKDDRVLVIAGDDKGKEAKVISVLRDKYKVIVEGINMVSRHTKPNATNPNGGIIKKEAPIHMSNVMLIDPKTNKPTRIRRSEKDGKSVRLSVKSGEVIK